MQKKTAFARGHCFAHKIADRYPKLLFLMKISILNCAIMLITLQLFAVGVSKGQNINTDQISFGSRNENLKEALKRLGEKSGFIIFYPSEKIESQKTVQGLPVGKRTIAATLNLLLSGSELDYKQEGERTIVLFTSPGEKIIQQSQIVITGRVIDEKGNGLAGVTIRRKGISSIAESTNPNGYFLVAVSDATVVLQFTYIGFRTREIRVSELKSPVIIIMADITGSLDEVQVTAYGRTTRRLNTGDQTTITAKDIDKYPAGNALVALQGNVPGLLITQASGTPGSTYSVNIRGLNSINAGSDPFYVIDGIPYSGGSFNSQRGSSVSSNVNTAYDALSFINPLDIESINVLKDADATAIYGSRAANGVILITTKKGRIGAAKIDVNVFSGIRQSLGAFDLLNTSEYLSMRREAIRNANSTVLPTDYDINGTWDTTRYSNYADVFRAKAAHTSNFQLGVSGGNNDLQYMLSGNYRTVSNFQRFAAGNDQTSSVHFNLNTGTPASRFNMALTTGFTFNKNDMPPFDLTSSILQMAPNSPELFNPNGTLNFENNTFRNPLLSSKLLGNSTIYNLTSSLVLGYRIMEGLNFQTTLGYNRQSLDEVMSSPITSISPTDLANGTKASSRFTHGNKMYWSIEPALNYSRAISKSTLSATVGWSLQKQYNDSEMLQATGYSSDLLLGNIAGGTAITPASLGVTINEYKYNAIFGRVNYNWSDKYILNLSGRYDGSSRFGENKRFHFFPAAGAAWIFSSERFVGKNLPFLSFGKLRASYGITGNDQIGNYGYLTNYAITTGTPYQGMPGVAPLNLPNADLSWETVAKSNLGLELKFFKDRIGFEGNYFINNTSDMISGLTLTSTTGFTRVTKNQQARVQNKGFDLTLNTHNISTKNFNWSTTVLFTRQRNRLKAFPGLSPAQQITLDQSVNVKRTFRYAGVNEQSGLYQFYDANGNITLNPSQANDLTELVNTNPDYFGSLSNTISYKGFSLSFMFRYVKQTGANMRGLLIGDVFPGYMGFNIPREMLDRWQKPGDVATYQKFSTGLEPILQQIQMRYANVNYGDASYIRLQNVSLAYQFPVRIASKLHMKTLRLYVNGENLATISGYGILDPENQSLQRIGPMRTIVLGIQASL
jgi:TonB-linked SusC/RagA family outer membrane protein